MYGTVAFWRAKNGKRDEIVALLQTQLKEVERFTPGLITSFVYCLDRDPDELIMFAAFDSRDSYAENARSPGQDDRFREVRKLLAADPEWNDGEVETYVLSAGADLHRARYGTVGLQELQPRKEMAIRDLIRTQLFEDEATPGHLVTYLIWLDRSPGKVYSVVVFDSRDSYVANARSDEQHGRYLALRALMVREPTWYDGAITPFLRF